MAIIKHRIGGHLVFSYTKCLPVRSRQHYSLWKQKWFSLGYPPFYNNDQFIAYQKILSGKIDFPRHFDYAAKQLLRKLLHTDQAQRLGSAKDGGNEIKREPWFVSVSWSDLYHRRVKPPIKPIVKSEGDTTNFDSYDEFDIKLTPQATKYEVQLFQDF